MRDKYLTTKEVAGHLHRDVRTVQRWIKDGVLKAYKLMGRDYFILAKDFEEFKNRMMIKAG